MKRIINNFKDIFPTEIERINQLPPLDPGKKRIYFTGTGRCGTTYISRVMKKLGLDFGHEIARPHGNSSYKLTPWCGELFNRGDSVIVRLFRDKKKTVESIMRQGYFHPGRVLYKGFAQVMPEVEKLKTYRERVNFYYDIWYRLTLFTHHCTYNIEEMTAKDLQFILKEAGHDYNDLEIRDAMESERGNINTNTHKANKINYEKEF